ncbi:hypothetical protein EYF80_058632 [Liparis tanakae]|uniref:Uncharacterized protein n=1 Tax=Liparis tanakae TaxID=230148 RepID=A0A4Z2ES77_9TELE|nr:hypothetical protein EYF80_058632 [Liparis tanakae]
MFGNIAQQDGHLSAGEQREDEEDEDDDDDEEDESQPSSLKPWKGSSCRGVAAGSVLVSGTHDVIKQEMPPGRFPAARRSHGEPGSLALRRSHDIDRSVWSRRRPQGSGVSWGGTCEEP